MVFYFVLGTIYAYGSHRTICPESLFPSTNGAFLFGGWGWSFKNPKTPLKRSCSGGHTYLWRDYYFPDINFASVLSMNLVSVFLKGGGVHFSQYNFGDGLDGQL